MTIDDIKATSEVGPDLSYDFITRPAYQHALVTGDTEFLRLTLREAMRLGIDQASLVHALQNHDEMTYELVHFSTKHKDDTYHFAGRDFLGAELAEHIRQTMRDKMTSPAADYNRVFTTNGIACTTATVAAAALGIPDPAAATDEEIAVIRRAHLLLAMYNALQPGVFALSGWDLCGTVTLEAERVEALIADGDTRWIERGAHDLMGVNPSAEFSASGMPRARSLYGTVPEQLADPNSFARQLKKVLDIRKKFGIASGELVDVPEVSHSGLLVMVNRIGSGVMQVTVLNFSRQELSAEIRSTFAHPGATVINAFTGEPFGTVNDANSFEITIAAHEGYAFVLDFR